MKSFKVDVGAPVIENRLNEERGPKSSAYCTSTAADNFLGEGRPSGGKVLYFGKALNISLDIKYEANYFSAYEVHLNNSVLFTSNNVYLPPDDRSVDSLIKHQSVLGELQYALDIVSSRRMIALGDFNVKGRFRRDLQEICI